MAYLDFFFFFTGDGGGGFFFSHELGDRPAKTKKKKAHGDAKIIGDVLMMMMLVMLHRHAPGLQIYICRPVKAVCIPMAWVVRGMEGGRGGVCGIGW